MSTLFLAWQAPQSREWYPVGRLQHEAGLYRFAYTAGALDAQEAGGFQPLVSFPDLRRVYEDDTLFPLFANRLLTPGHADYREFTEWLNVPEHEADPVALLARSGGHRPTDTLEVFPCPERGDDGLFRVHFFAHGLRHQTEAAQERVGTLEPGERLRLQWDRQNTRDPQAHTLRTDERSDGDMHTVGYVPRYLAEDVAQLPVSEDTPIVEVERVNAAAPVYFRLLCRLSASWPEGFSPFAVEGYQTIR